MKNLNEKINHYRKIFQIPEEIKITVKEVQQPEVPGISYNPRKKQAVILYSKNFSLKENLPEFMAKIKLSVEKISPGKGI